MKVLVNGYFFLRKITGIERYAQEILLRIDKLAGHHDIAIIIPSNTATIPRYDNIDIITKRYLLKNKYWWQFVTLQLFLFTHRCYTILDFSNICLPLTPGIAFLHDIYCEFFPEDFMELRNRLIRIYNRWQYRVISRKAKKIVTVSEFSKAEICRTFSVDPSRISVIYSSADHMDAVKADASIFTDYPILGEKPFYFLLGSLSKRKNLKWVIEYAQKNPEALFAISGLSLSTVKVNELEKGIPSNIIMLGYLDDSKVKALMERCRAFILPSYYEGFGLTPLEALSCGAKIIVANAASLPEIYGNAAHYIDPNNTDVDLEALLEQDVDNGDDILSKYSYDTAARQVYDLIMEYTN